MSCCNSRSGLVLDAYGVNDYLYKNAIIEYECAFSRSFNYKSDFDFGAELFNYLNKRGFEKIIDGGAYSFWENYEERLYIAIELYTEVFGAMLYSNSEDFLEEIEKTFREGLVTRTIKVDLFKIERGSLSESTISINPEEVIEDLSLDLFKLSGVDVEKLAEEFYKSKDTILLIFGEPGLGKSKLALFLSILLLTKRSRGRIKLIKGYDILEKFPSEIGDSVYSFSKKTSNLFIFDDIDFNTLKRGENPESDKFVSFLLSITDGVIPQYNKFIITSNRDINDFDKALLRPGRTFAIINLKKINLEDLRNYDENLAREIYDENRKEEYTLAEIGDFLYNKKNRVRKSFVTKEGVLVNNITKRMGF